MKVALVGRCINTNSGQGVYKASGQLYDALKQYTDLEIVKIDGNVCSHSLVKRLFFDLVSCPIKVLFSKADVYHFLMPDVCLPLLFSKKLREKSVVTLHDAIPMKANDRKSSYVWYMNKMAKIARKAKLVIVPSEEAKEDVVKYFDVDKRKISFIPWCVDLDFMKKVKVTKSKKTTVGFLGGLGSRKNADWLIKAAKEFQDFEFIIGGKGPELENLIELKKELKVNNVNLVGFIPEKEIPKFYSSLDIFVFPSLFEGFGMPWIEAMACEVPYIIGGNTAIAKSLPIIKINSYEDLINSLKNIKNRKTKPLKDSRKWLIKNKFTWQEHARKTLEVYKKC